ncbi:MAG: dihydrodipicolinate synthase family protein [Rhodospirillales bacterium 20-64-7]|nr:MAG: dihydrodipicolinate synthase family protein [Rhodospirillales bacterium 20-64-7]
MKTTPVTPADLKKSVLSVPPFARNADLSINAAANQTLIRHLEDGGVSTLLYGGNANFYHISIGEYPAVLDTLEQAAGAQSWVIPSIGPDFGRMMDQARILKGRNFPTAMALPIIAPATPSGVEAGLARAAEAFGRPLITYIKTETYLSPAAVGRLVKSGAVCAIKYAIERKNPREDAYLTALLGEVPAAAIVSGMGERPALVHLQEFGLSAFTSGSVSVAPALSQGILLAAQKGDYATAAALREKFLPLEDLRDGLHQIRVLHEAVSLAGIAPMGPILPLLSNIEPEHHDAIRAAATTLLAANRAGLKAAA